MIRPADATGTAPAAGNAASASYAGPSAGNAGRPPAAPLVLASASPRRRDLLAQAGLAFRVAATDIDEDRALADRPATGAAAASELAVELAARKAVACAAREAGFARILAADTVVVAPDGALLAKPLDAASARAMIERLSGRVHAVVTGIALLDVPGGALRTRAVESAVRFRDLSPAEIDAYLTTDLWRGKAGGYGVQDEPSLVAGVTGSRTNVIGLPMEALAEMLELC